MRGFEPGAAFDELYPAHAERGLDTVRHLPDKGVLAGGRPREVELVADAEDAHQAKFLRFHVTGRRIEQEIGRDAGVMDAGTAGLISFDERNRRAQRGCPECR